MTRLDAIKARVAAATEGPWKWMGPSCETILVPVGDNEHMPVLDAFGDANNHTILGCPHDKDFIAHAREDVPWLIAEVERMNRLYQLACEGTERRHVALEQELVKRMEQLLVARKALGSIGRLSEAQIELEPDLDDKVADHIAWCKDTDKVADHIAWCKDTAREALKKLEKCE